MNTEKRIAIACFAGAALGALLALQLNYFWWVGIAVGGGIGYLSFRFKEALKAACVVWNSLPDAKAAIGAMNTGIWNFLRLVAAVIGVVCFAASILVLMIGLVMSLVLGTEMSVQWEGPVMAASDLGIPPQYWILGAVVFLLATLFLWICVLRSTNRKATLRGIMGCLLFSPPILPFTLAVAVGRAIVPPTSRALIRLGAICLKAGRQTFILIHSEIRLLCLTDAMLGALAGYFCGSALIGGVVGAICGLASYKLISIRWLKLQRA